MSLYEATERINPVSPRDNYYQSIQKLRSDSVDLKPDALAELALSVNEITRGSIKRYISHVSKNSKFSFLLTSFLEEIVKTITDYDHHVNESAIDLIIYANDRYDMMYSNCKLSPIKLTDDELYNSNVGNEINTLMRNFGFDRTLSLLEIIIDLEY